MLYLTKLNSAHFQLLFINQHGYTDDLCYLPALPTKFQIFTKKASPFIAYWLKIPALSSTFCENLHKILFLKNRT